MKNVLFLEATNKDISYTVEGYNLKISRISRRPLRLDYTQHLAAWVTDTTAIENNSLNKNYELCDYLILKQTAH